MKKTLEMLGKLLPNDKAAADFAGQILARVANGPLLPKRVARWVLSTLVLRRKPKTSSKEKDVGTRR